MAERIPWEYFILRRHIDGMGMINYFKGDTKEACVSPIPMNRKFSAYLVSMVMSFVAYSICERGIRSII